MKKSIYIYGILLAVAAALTACSHDLNIPIDFEVKLADNNTFKTGDPVRFDIDGTVDNIVFFSGEDGHRYEFRDRYEYDTSDIEAITLDINYGIWYGQNQMAGDPTQLETWICTSWDSDKISWSDFEADSLALVQMRNDGMPGWERLEFTDDITKIGTYVPYTYNLDPKYVDGLVIAFHFIPTETFDSSIWRRFYRIYGLLTTRFAGATPFTLNFFSMSWQTITFNTIPAARYNFVTDNSGVKIATSGVYTMMFDARKYWSSLKYPVPEAWAICKPIRMNKANPDTGESIKNLQNVMRSYEHIYEAPGKYKAVFVGNNRNYKCSSRQVHEVEFTIQ
ncbi:MAG: DUF5017 domain-containing protein [Bacteroidales bacterium]|nr:DUF5017 domain-containing protein [Bacteroidales bacterium]